MPAVDQCFLTIAEVAPLLQTKRLSPVELTHAYLKRIDSQNPSVHAYITLLHDEALEQARAMETEIAGGHYRGPLHGVPIAVKDIFATNGHRTTCGSKVLKENITHYDATAVTRLKQSGCILLGKLTMSEFAFGDDVNPISGQRPTHNPWNLERSASGSSSGSGAAVAASMCAAALGTDTGGSIRLPSAFYITVNAGFGDAHSAAEEVEYLNGATSTPMGAMRARNGHPDRITSSSGTSATSPTVSGSSAAPI